jgi:5-methylcytosine-specific restriction endonuclease McrA
VGADGSAPDALSTRTIARHVVRLYLPQVRSYQSDGAPPHLRQITTKQSAALRSVTRLHDLGEGSRNRTIGSIAGSFPREFGECVDEVEQTFARYPLRLLQVVGQEDRPFLYDISWGQSVTLADLHAPGGGQVVFRPNAGDRLLQLAPLVRPLIELHWTRMVARINRIALEDERLHDHLFGSERARFPALIRSGLHDLQHGDCFYCGESLTTGTQIDHFIPWSRCRNDAIENLVLADRCNTEKSDYLPANTHVDRWALRLASQRDELGSLGTDAGWETNPERSLAIARSSYAHLPRSTPLWLRAGQFTDAEPDLISARLADLPL